MKVIHKYQLVICEEQIITLPAGYQILSVQEQGDHICMWAVVDPYNSAPGTAIINIFGTGYAINDDIERQFIGTVQIRGLVWHIFEQLQ